MHTVYIQLFKWLRNMTLHTDIVIKITTTRPLNKMNRLSPKQNV